MEMLGNWMPVCFTQLHSLWSLSFISSWSHQDTIWADKQRSWGTQSLLDIFTTLHAMSFVRKHDFSHRRCWVWNRTSCTTHCGKCVILNGNWFSLFWISRLCESHHIAYCKMCSFSMWKYIFTSEERGSWLLSLSSI